MQLTLYSKADCSLCDKAKDALKIFEAEHAHDLTIVDIAMSPELFEKYKYDVPVLLIDGIEAAKHFISVEKLRVLMRRFSGG